MTFRRTLPLVALALAGAPLPVLAAEPEFLFSGIGQAAGVYATSPAPGGDRWSAYAGYGLTGEMEVTTDSGMRYGLVGTVGSGDYERSLNRPGTNEKVTLNEGYIYLTSAWGGLRIGDEDGAAKRAIDLMPLIGGGQFDGYWTGVAGAEPFADHLGRNSDDATKILYETPRLFGLRAGLSYAPERDSLVEDLKDPSFVPAEDDFWEFGLNYRGDAAAVSYELAAGYGFGEGGAPGVDDTRHLSLAGLLLYGGFSAGAVWFDDEVGLPGGGGTDVNGLTLQGNYENGPYGLTVWWQTQEADAISDYEAYGLGLSWRVRPEATLGLDLVRYANEPVGPANNDKGVAVQVSGTLRF